MLAVYIDSNQFTVSGDKTSEFLVGRRIRANCGGTYKYSTVQLSTYSDPSTTVTIEENILTSDLVEAYYGIVSMGNQGSLPNHSHDGNEGMGGSMSLLTLSDTPNGYEQYKYLSSTASGSEWSLIAHNDITALDYTSAGHTGFASSERLSAVSGTLQTDIDGKADIDHLHDDRYYTGAEVDSISGTLQTDIDTHLHDARYYTGAEVDSISGTLRTDIDNKPDISWHLADVIPDDLTGKENDVAVNREFGIIYERLIDVGTSPTKLNTLDKHSGLVLSNNDLTVEHDGTGYTEDRSIRAVKSVSTGKWYYEATSFNGSMSNRAGWANATHALTVGVGSASVGYGLRDLGDKFQNGGCTSSYADYWFSAGSVCGVAIDFGAGKLWYSINGVWIGNPVTGTDPANTFTPGITLFPMLTVNPSTPPVGKLTANFGASAFSYQIPSGFTAGPVALVDNDTTGWIERFNPSFTKLNDTPSTYTDGRYLRTTTTGIEFTDEVVTISGVLQEQIDSKPDTFLDLTDTPSSYDGIEDNYLRATTSGITTVSGIILKAPNNSEWCLCVTNSGTLYTVSV